MAAGLRRSHASSHRSAESAWTMAFRMSASMRSSSRSNGGRNVQSHVLGRGVLRAEHAGESEGGAAWRRRDEGRVAPPEFVVTLTGSRLCQIHNWRYLPAIM